MSVISQLLGNDNKLASPASVATHVVDFGGVDLSDVAQGIAELEQDFRDISDVENYADQCEMMANFAESTLADRGMNRQTAALFNAVLGQAEDRLGIMNTNLGTESFGDADSAVRATELGCENLQVKAKAVWDTIKKAILAIRDKIMKIVRGFMDKIPGLIKKFKAIMDKADKTTDPIKENKVEVSTSLMSQLHINNKLDSSVVLAGIKEMGDMVVATYDASKAGIKSRKDAVDSLNPKDIQMSLVKAAAIVTPTDGMGSIESSDKRIAGTEDQEVQRTKELLGGRAVFSLTTKEDVVKAKAAGAKSISAIINTTEEKRSEASKKKLEDAIVLVKLMTKEKYIIQSYLAKPKDITDSLDVETIPAAKVSDIADTVIDFLEDMKKLPKFQEDMDKSSRAQLKKADDAEKIFEAENYDPQVRKLGRAVVNSISKMGGTLDSHALKMVTMFTTVSNAVADYCNKSLAQHKA